MLGRTIGFDFRIAAARVFARGNYLTRGGKSVAVGVVLAFVGGCTTYHVEPPSEAPRAQIRVEREACLFNCGGSVTLISVDGTPVNSVLKANNFFIKTGEAVIGVAVNDIGLYGECEMKLMANDGETYELSHELDGVQVVVTANDSSGADIASCSTRLGVAPAGPTYIPIIISSI